MREKTIIPIMFCFDKNYLIPACVAAYSLLENAARSVEFANECGKSPNDRAESFANNRGIITGGGA